MCNSKSITPFKSRRGAVLIFVLWAVSFLAIIAAHLGYGIRQKILFMKRIELRSQINHNVQSGIKMARALLFEDIQKNDFRYSPMAKAFRHNNRERFETISVGDGISEVSYWAPTDDRRLEKRYGIVDEESKININTANKLVLQQIIGLALSFDEEYALKIAESIIDWRMLGESEVKGFFSDDYYSNLEYPYPKKSEPFELIDELLLVKGIDEPMFDVLKHYLTVYGDGTVNINTASKSVLMALGLESQIVDKFLKVRRGPDGIENTLDDHVFLKTYDVAAEVASVVNLEEEEVRAIDQINLKGLLTTNSYYYSIHSNAMNKNSEDQKIINCVVSTKENRIVYWKEK